MKNKLFTVVVIVTFIIIACKKDAQQLIFGTWNLTSVKVDTFKNNQLTKETSLYTAPADFSIGQFFYIFYSNSKVNRALPLPPPVGTFDTVTYKVIDSKRIIISSDTLPIITLTSKSFTHYGPVIYNSNDTTVRLSFYFQKK